MKKLATKTTTGKFRLMARRSTVKGRASIRTAVMCKVGQGKTSRFCYQILPFVKNLSKKDVAVSRILEDSYKRGVATASHSEV